MLLPRMGRGDDQAGASNSDGHRLANHDTEFYAHTSLPHHECDAAYGHRYTNFDIDRHCNSLRNPVANQVPDTVRASDLYLYSLSNADQYTYPNSLSNADEYIHSCSADVHIYCDRHIHSNNGTDPNLYADFFPHGHCFSDKYFKHTMNACNNLVDAFV